MRGKLRILSRLERAAGITPAHAGKTGPRRRRGFRLWDHPRACGENGFLKSSFATERGSPPRMRGKRGLCACTENLMGITPAHAGKTAPLCSSLRCLRDHPRACGENTLGQKWNNLDLGSPPRMRGKRIKTAAGKGRIGITPAHAGKTLRKGRISVVDPSPQPRSSLTSRRADASIGSQRAPCAAPV